MVVVRACQPFEDWAKGIDEEAPTAYDSSGKWSNAYLIPEFNTEEDAWEWLEANCGMLFELELDSWYTDPEAWPEDRSWNAFREWFDVELIEMAWDLVDEPLSSEPPESPRGVEA
ncbi:MAG: hypothetical protein EA351_00670 [Gemmatimonadales bacterium]|nr:MAG: hypothetical protein EA351_00670 [Gemmatimonadales bacterium]